MNLFGITLTLIGGACEFQYLPRCPSARLPLAVRRRSIAGYAKVELQEKQSRSAALNSANVAVARLEGEKA